MTEIGATATTPQPRAEGLLQRSKFFAQSAMVAYSSESWDVFYLHLAVSVELLAKAILARAHPSFISDPRASFDSLLHLSGFSGRTKKTESASVRTIDAREALARVGSFVDNYREPGLRVKALIEARNGIVHGGRPERVEADVVLGEVAQYLSQLLNVIGINGVEYWGASAEMVADHAELRLNAAEAAYARKLQAARNRLAELESSMTEESFALIVAAVAPPAAAPPYDAIPVECPACGHKGVLIGIAEAGDWEADYDSDGGIPYVDGVYVSTITFGAESFRCSVCQLQLYRDELDGPDLSYLTLTRDQYDLGEASDYFGRLAEEDLAGW